MKRQIALLSLMALSVFCPSLNAQTDPPGPRSQEGRGPGRPPFNPSPEEREKFRQRLGITTQQQEQMDALFADSHKQRMALDARLRELFGERSQVCDVYDFDHNRERAIRNEIQKVYNQILTIHLNTEEKLRRILNREQFEKLRALRKEMRDKWPKRSRRWGDPNKRPS